MKRLFLFVLIALFGFACVVQARPTFGIKGSLNMSTATVSPLANGISKESILGFLLGGMVEAPLSQDKSFGIRGEVSWQEKGVKFTANNGFEKETVDELAFSPFLVYNVSGLIENARPFIQAGPELAFVLSSNDHTEIDNVGTSDQDIKNVASTDFSINIGAGLGLPLNNQGEVVFDLRYCIGMSDMDNTSAVKSKLRGFLISVGYNFPPKK